MENDMAIFRLSAIDNHQQSIVSPLWRCVKWECVCVCVCCHFQPIKFKIKAYARMQSGLITMKFIYKNMPAGAFFLSSFLSSLCILKTSFRPLYKPFLI